MASIKKKKLVRWVDKAGKRVSPGTPGAKKLVEKSAKYYAYRVPGYERNKAIPLATSKSVSETMLGELIRKAEAGEAGLVDTVVVSKDLLLKDQITEFREYVRARGKTSETQIDLQETRLRKVVAGCNWQRIRDMDGEDAAKYLAERRGKTRKDGGISIQTSNFYRTHLRSFGDWLLKKKRIKDNPFHDLKPLDANVDRKHARRDLAEEEVERLLKATQTSERVYRGLTGRSRAWLYLMASATGFRASELASLTPRHFDLDSDPPVVKLARRQTKNKKGSPGQPLPSAMVPMLRPWLAELDPNSPLWPGTWPEKAAQMLKKDLAECVPPIPYVVQGIDGPEFADLHSLRHYYVTALSKSATIKVAQMAARHSSVSITEKYTHARLGEIATAVNLLPFRMDGSEVRQLSPEQIAQLAFIGWTVVSLLLTPEKENCSNPGSNHTNGTT
jgi:integrase